VCFGRKGRRPRLHHYELPQSFDARASTPYSVEDCRHPHIVPEQQESEKSAERRRQQLVAERWHVDTGVACIRSSVDMVEPIIQHSLRLQQETAPGRNVAGDMGCVVPSQGAWYADLKAISGASTELPSRIIQKVWERHGGAIPQVLTPSL